MRGVSVIAAAAIGFGAITVALAADSDSGRRPEANQSAPPTVPPMSGTTSSDLGRSGGVIAPPADVDPRMRQMPPPSGDPMPVVRPPETPGGDPSVNPK
jgi:hypothetical protein